MGRIRSKRSTIRLSLTLEIKYSILNEKSPSDLWEKFEKIYMSKFLINKLYLKKQLFELKMDKWKCKGSYK